MDNSSNRISTSGDKLSHLFMPAKFREEEAEKIAYSNYSYWGSTVREFLKSKFAVISLIVMVVVLVFAFIQPFLPDQQPHDKSPYLNNLDMWKQPPSSKHWFGTDDIGRDLWARVWNGTRISISLAFLVVITETFIGVIVGAIWGYLPKIDRFMTELYNLVANIPTVIVLILLTFILRPGYWTMYMAMSMTGWLYMAKTMRNLVIVIRDREYNMASKCLGTPLLRMVTKNLLPQLISIIIMRTAVSIPSVIGSETFLTYLGIGLPLEVPSLGVLIGAGRTSFTFRPHLMLFPATIVSIITVTFYVVGNAFADASDPRNHT